MKTKSPLKCAITFFFCFFTFAVMAQNQTYYNVTAGNGYGVRFWNGSNYYRIAMGNSSEYTYGPVTSYSIKMNMNNTSGRGWTWGISGAQPIAALDNKGFFQVERDLTLNNGWVRVKGNNGLTFQNHGGGFYMQDATWIRTFGNKSFYHNSGIMRTDGTFQVGSGGNRFVVNTSGNIGVGITNPSEKLHINGSIRGNASGGSLRIKTSSGYVDVGAQNSSWAHIYTDRAKFITNKPLWVIGGKFSSYSSSNLYLQTNNTSRLTILNSNGNVGIGTLSPDEKLTVKGKIHTQEVRVDLNGAVAPDYVFEKDYNLRPLNEIENYINENKHLPEIPSAKEMEKEGINLKEMNLKLLQKIEELTLHTIQQQKELNAQSTMYKELVDRLEKLEKQIVNKK